MPFPRVLRRRGFWFGVVCVCLLTYFYLYLVPIKKTSDEFPHTRLPRFIWLSLDNTSTLSQCRNSVQGPKLIADELGYVCPLSWVLPTGCCNIDYAVRFDCSSCLQTTDCCAVYEHCVSCCLRSDKKPILEAILTHSASSLHPLYTSVKDQFELCLSKCRTSSQSVYHENSYRKPDTKYCYGQEFGIITTTSTVHNHKVTRSKTEESKI